MLGADWTRDRWTAGLLLSRSESARASYRGGPGRRSGVRDGRRGLLDADGSLSPTGNWRVNERLTVWGVAGYGAGELTLAPQNPQNGVGGSGDDGPTWTS